MIGSAARAALLAGLALGAGCTTKHTLRTSPAPGTRVQVDFAERRNIDVLVRSGRDSVPFDGVATVYGWVSRTSADTLWLDRVYVDSAGKQVYPGPGATLRVTGVGREAAVSEVRFSAIETAAGAAGIAVGIAALLLVLLVTTWHEGGS